MSTLIDLFSLLIAGDLHWRAPIWLWGLLLPFVMLIITRLRIRKSQIGYADAHLWPWVQVEQAEMSAQKTAIDSESSRPAGSYTPLVLSRLKNGLQCLKNSITPLRLLGFAWIMLMIAVSGPRGLQVSESETTRGGVDLLVVMDLSHSMTATDVYPSRFLQAKTLVESLKNSLQQDDRLGLMVFAGQPHLVSPLSFDRELFQHNLDLIEPNMLPTQGSWLELGLIDGVNHLAQTGGQAKVMLVLTNGAPAFWATPEIPSRLANMPYVKELSATHTGVKTVMVGIGKPTPSTLVDETHSSGKLHANGLLVQSRLEEINLKKWAQNLQGTYLRGSETAEFMQRLLAEVTLPAGERNEQNSQQRWVEFSQPFIVLSVIAMLLEFYPVTLFAGRSNRKVKEVKSTVLSPSVLAGLLVLGALLISSLFSQSAFANDSNVGLEQRAFNAFQQQNYEQATELYDQLNTHSGWMGAGSSAYKAGDLETAVLYFRQAALSAPQDPARAQALFNLGNSYYFANLLPQAMESYQQALLYRADYPQAEHNLALAERRFKFEQANKKLQSNEEEGEGAKGRGRGEDEAFYGGQKPIAGTTELGFGTDDLEERERTDSQVILPLEGDSTDYQLQGSADTGMLELTTQASDNTANAIINRAQQQRRAERFQQQLRQIDDKQKELLKRMFEREEGFQAAQEKPHEIPGVQPW